MRICAVQLASLKGDLAANLHRHLHALEQAAALGAELAVFPELSLSGYEPSLARAFAQATGPEQLAPLQATCDRLGITAAVGLPLAVADGVRIGMPVVQPSQPPLIYAKQRLHADELDFFVAGSESLVFNAGKLRIALAICYESMFIEHAEQAQTLGADFYLVSVAKTEKGVREGFAHYPQVAKQLRMPVLMSNCVGPADTFTGAGCSAAWDDNGVLLASLGSEDEGLVMLDTLEMKAQTYPLVLGRGPLEQACRGDKPLP